MTTKLYEVKGSTGSFDYLDQTIPRSGDFRNIEFPDNEDPEMDLHSTPDYDYFITINISTRQKVMATHYDAYKRKVIRGKWLWEELSQKEQHAHIEYKLQKVLNWLHLNEDSLKYHFFFEATKAGNIHLHGRIKVPFIKHFKDLRLYFHQYFEIPITDRHFMDIKRYNHKKWSDYENKTSKGYQTTDYKPISL